ncbi:MAG: hypothetical protein U0M02_07070 [Acutalibacteraceae bacterium]|nr:hypothetical protein [Acutalibacteraceae bacterium]
MSNAFGLGGIEQIIIEELNKIYFPNGMPLIPEDKKKEIFEHIDQKFREIEEKLKEGGEG